MKIEVQEIGSKGMAFVAEENKVLAQMTYSIASSELIIIDHTEVNLTLKGKGVGKQLLMVIVEKARKEKFKILPLCPFAKSVFERDKTINDVLR
ncbi:MAG: putative GNAT family acetyltransferase [Spirosomataceae bacterium]|jgi:predicted GNAT family acetyltransferase